MLDKPDHACSHEDRRPDRRVLVVSAHAVGASRPQGRQPSRRHSYAMRKFYLFYGVAALAATLILFMGWLAEREKQAGMDRLERSELHHTSGAGR